MVERLPSKHKELSSNSSTAKKIKSEIAGRCGSAKRKKKKKKSQLGGVVEVLKGLLTKPQALSSSPSTAQPPPKNKSNSRF
jgi:hypothetical protein